MTMPPAVPWPVLRRLQRLTSESARRGLAHCEMCSVEIQEEHGHVVNTRTRAILCVCRPCYLVFTHDGAGGGRFRAVPQRYRLLPDFAAAQPQWEALQLPIGLAFVMRSSATGRAAALYPSPAGATESELPLDAWDALAGAVPALQTLEADVEALLVRRRNAADGGDGAAVTDALIVPIDACYELAGRIRRLWRGFQGGDELWRDVDGFFERARQRAADGVGP